jgi:hypothetical protein
MPLSDIIISVPERRRHSTRKADILRMLWFYELKRAYKCIRCPEDHPACIDFHHRAGEMKVEAVATMVAKHFGKEAILAEIAKCDAICANCHRKLHDIEREGARAARLDELAELSSILRPYAAKACKVCGAGRDVKPLVKRRSVCVVCYNETQKVKMMERRTTHEL